MKNIIKFFIGLLTFGGILISFQSCHIHYGMVGGNLPIDVKTISVQHFPNYAPLVNPSLSQTFSEKLKDKFLSQTKLSLAENNGDIRFEGSITGYSTSPISIQGNETAALNRLTISVSIKFTNTKDEKQNFESAFSRFADYPSSQPLSSVEEELVRQISEQLVDDIFNRAVVNW